MNLLLFVLVRLGNVCKQHVDRYLSEEAPEVVEPQSFAIILFSGCTEQYNGQLTWMQYCQ
jgi:hypothetical protein